MERLTRITCGWCGRAAEPSRCGYCGRDPGLPYVQRGVAPPAVVSKDVGRPALNEHRIAQKLAVAVEEIGPDATVEQIAELIGVSPRTIRRWKKAIDGR